MQTDRINTCPFCVEEVPPDAARCPWCDTVLEESRGRGHTEVHWRRVEKGKRIAGVCTGIARELNNPGMVMPLRLMFLILLLFGGFGAVAYIALWMLMSPPEEKESARIADPAVRDYPPRSTARSATRPERTGRTGSDRFLGTVLLMAGLFFILIALVRTWPMFPVDWVPSIPLDTTVMAPATIPLLVLLGLAVLLLGAMRIFRAALGCGMIILAGLLLLVFLPFLPLIAWLIPAVLVVGLMALIVGIVKLLT